MDKLAGHIRRLKNSQQGAALVLVALSIVALIGFTALAVDGGYLYFRHTRLQDISDATAIAAGIELVNAKGNEGKKKTDAFDVAVKYAERHGLKASNKSGYSADIQWGSEPGRITVSFPDNLNKVMVQLTLDASTFYARALGTTSTPVGVTSIVQIGQASQQQGNLIPVAFFWGEYQWWTRYKMTLTPGAGSSGNFGFLDYGPPSEFKNYLRNGYNGTLEVGQHVETYPGESVGQVDKAINDRISACTHTCWVNGANDVHVDDSCPRVVIVPIVENFFDENGKHNVKITAFAKFFIEAYNKDSKELIGWFLQTVEPSEITEGNPQFTTQAVKLVR
jgi:hypothetical protein